VLIRVAVGVDDLGLRERLVRLLSDPDILLGPVCGGEELAARIPSLTCDLVVVEGHDHARWAGTLASLPDRPSVAALLRDDDPKARAELLATGASAVLDFSLPDDLLGPALGGWVDQRRQAQRRHYDLHRRGKHETELVCRSEVMQATINTARRVARADSPVMLLGETGVGKERLAMMIHASSPRSHGPFLAVNCAALPAELFESELFGHEKGAFTGASRARRGHFELAHEGTLFLDEVGEVPLHLQAKLLRVLQEHRIKPLGSEHSVEIDVRVLAATNRDLGEEMAQGRFRRDLYYRLGVVEIRIPSLRDRTGDIAAMAEVFLQRYATALNRGVEGFSAAAMDALERYDWPGNVRELTNVVERAVLLCQEQEIQPSDLPSAIAACGLSPASDDAPTSGEPLFLRPPTEPLTLPNAWQHAPWKVVREELLVAGERAYLEAILAACEGRVGEAARRAGISTRALFEKMKRHGLRKETFRRAGG